MDSGEIRLTEKKFLGAQLLRHLRARMYGWLDLAGRLRRTVAQALGQLQSRELHVRAALVA